MTINELHQHFADLDFQANKMLKSRSIDQNYLSKYASVSEIVKENILKLSISPEIDREISLLGTITIDFIPKLTLVAQCQNILTFGFSKKIYQLKKRERYFRDEIQKRKLLFNYVEKQLKTI